MIYIIINIAYDLDSFSLRNYIMWLWYYKLCKKLVGRLCHSIAKFSRVGKIVNRGILQQKKSILLPSTLYLNL